MQTLYIFCLLWSALVLAAAAAEEATEVKPSNGFQCPTCRNLTDTCQDTVELCHGEENFCFNSAGTILNADGSTKSKFVSRGCIAELVLNTLLGPENVNSNFTYKLSDMAFETAQQAPQPSSTATIDGSATNTTEKPDNITAAPVTKTTGSSPHLSSSLCFALFLPSMCWVLLTTMLS